MVLRLMLLMLRCLEQGEQRDLEEQVGLQTRSARTHTHTHRHTPATQFPSGPRCHTRPPVDGSDAALLMAACVCACVSVSECVHTFTAIALAGPDAGAGRVVFSSPRSLTIVASLHNINQIKLNHAVRTFVWLDQQHHQSPAVTPSFSRPFGSRRN